MKMYYLAHPVRGDVRDNMFLAMQWLWYLNSIEGARFFVIAPWLPELAVFDDGDDAQRNAGFERNLAALRRCDGIMLCGPNLSVGMGIELGYAKALGLDVIDTWLGTPAPPRYEGLPL